MKNFHFPFKKRIKNDTRASRQLLKGFGITYISYQNRNWPYTPVQTKTWKLKVNLKVALKPSKSANDKLMCRRIIIKVEMAQALSYEIQSKTEEKAFQQEG